MSYITYKFDPPLTIPPMSQASIAPIARGRALRVVVADAVGVRIAEGVYRRDPRTRRHLRAGGRYGVYVRQRCDGGGGGSMPLGPGKYDDLATYAREKAKARGVALIVIGETPALSGFSVQADLATTFMLPALLRTMANEIERSTKV